MMPWDSTLWFVYMYACILFLSSVSNIHQWIPSSRAGKENDKHGKLDWSSCCFIATLLCHIQERKLTKWESLWKANLLGIVWSASLEKNPLFQLVRVFADHGLGTIVNNPMTVGVALTCFALIAATVGVKTGNRAYANNMFRLRGRKGWNRIIDGIIWLIQHLFCSGCSRFYSIGHGWWFSLLHLQGTTAQGCSWKGVVIVK